MTMTADQALETAVAHLDSHECMRMTEWGELSLCKMGSALFYSYNILSGVTPSELEFDRAAAYDTEESH